MARRPVHSEKVVSRGVVKLLRLCGFAVWDTGQGYRKDPGGTRITPGLADLIVIGKGRVVFIELKSSLGTLRDSQRVFRDECRANDVEWHMWRSVGECEDWLKENGWLK